MGPLRTTSTRFWHFWAIFGPRISLSARVAKIPVNRRFRPAGVRRKKKLFPRKLRKSIPDGVVAFFFGFGTPSAPQPKKGPVGSLGPLACLLLACLLLACLLQVQAPPRDPNNWINRSEVQVLQLGDPNPNLCWVLCVARPLGRGMVLGLPFLGVSSSLTKWSPLRNVR